MVTRRAGRCAVAQFNTHVIAILRTKNVPDFIELSKLVVYSGVARNLLRGRQKKGSGDGSPSAGPGAEPRWGSGAKPPEAGEKC